MPTILPTGSATSTPQNAGESSPNETAGMATSAAENANSGRTTPLTHGSSACRVRSAGCCAIARPSATPAIVAWTPDSDTNTQVAIASTTSAIAIGTRARRVELPAQHAEEDDRDDRRRRANPKFDVGGEQRRR